ncbi:metallophosphoesterase family protein [Edaphobacter modestus]|uniref:Secreted protein n=1 Tax=Edaphobacter modestus TaxID=388466 RepID=A0A4Q7YYS8_9BACT|nr:metallophosphoesterase [Edaphobacter modestus]RZU42644.1 secreted protein [Edaphobacter modestus]
MTTRREFLTLIGAAGAAAAAPSSLLAAPAAESFSFLFVTDTHIQPELDAAKGTEMAFRKARGIKADFAIQGGDHVFDSLAVPKERALSLFDLYGKTEQDLGMKVYHTIGNHDVVGIYPKSGVAPTDPLYGKKLFEDRFGKVYYSFDHKGHHFMVLDSIGVTSDRAYEGRIDAEQIQWISRDLAALPKGTPVIVSVHIPLVSAFSSYVPLPTQPEAHHGLTIANANEVLPLFEGHNVLGVLQGHTHINERVEWHGIPYITSGAVSGNWWQGVRMGTPEGFTVVTVANGRLTTRYETYGFKSVDPHNT